jgi:hypothetical protein
LRRPWPLAAGLTLMALPALAVGEYDGSYRATPETDCALSEGERAPLRIKDDVFYGLESRCAMTNPVPVRDMDAMLYDMDCAGEGEAWRARALFMRAAEGGLVMVWDGYAFQYGRCPEQP